VGLAGIDASRPQHRQSCVQAVLRPISIVPNSGIAFFLIVADQADAVGQRSLDQPDATILAGRSNSGDIDPLTALQASSEGRTTLTRISAVRRVEAVCSAGTQQGTRDRFDGGAETGVRWTGAAVDHMSVRDELAGVVALGE
jgi:hypothetical protein